MKDKAQSERTRHLDMVEANIAEAVEDAKVAEQKVRVAEEESNKAIKTREKERDRIIEAEKDSKDKIQML